MASVPGTEASSVPVAVPVIVGAAQQIDRPEEHELLDAPGPIELMVAAARAAAIDAGAPALLDRVGWIGVAGGFFSHTNPGAVVAATGEWSRQRDGGAREKGHPCDGLGTVDTHEVSSWQRAVARRTVWAHPRTYPPRKGTTSNRTQNLRGI